MTLNEICADHNLLLYELSTLIGGSQENVSFDGNFSISRKEYQNFLELFLSSRKGYQDIEQTHNLGKVIEANVIEKIDPSILLVNFGKGYSGRILLKHINANFLIAQSIYNTIHIGQRLSVAILHYDHPNKICELSLNHLKNQGQIDHSEYHAGERVAGEVHEKLNTKTIISLPSGGFGIVQGTNENNKSHYIITGAYEDGLYSLASEKNFQSHGILQEQQRKEFNFIDPDFQNYINFERSNYFKFTTETERAFIKNILSRNRKIFSKDFESTLILYIQFQLESPAWENDFKNKFLYELIDDYDGNPTNEAINRALARLGKEKFWLRFNTTDKGERFVLFNNNFFILGGFKLMEEQLKLEVFSISLNRQKRNHSLQKRRNARAGTILYNSRIIFLSPLQNPPFDYDIRPLVELLQDKFRALQILSRLKKASGEILRTEGQALQIFDKFLEYQIEQLKSNETEPFKILDYKNIPAKNGVLTIEVFLKKPT